MVFLAPLLLASTLYAPVPESGSFRGAVAVEAAGADVAVYVDTNRDGSIDHRFRLQREPEDGGDAVTPSVFPSAHVAFEPGYLRITAGNEVYELLVPGAPGDGWNPRGMRVWRRTGYGLSHTDTGETGIAIARPGRERSITAEFCDASSDCDAGDTSEDGGTGGSNTGGTLCDSGGPGSSSCSTSGAGGSCSTTCVTGYYACCMQGSPPKCRCIRGG